MQKPREQTRIGSVLPVLRKSLEDGAPFPALTPQIGSVLKVLSRVLAVLRETFEVTGGAALRGSVLILEDWAQILENWAQILED